jgi:penicillin-binding protein 2
MIFKRLKKKIFQSQIIDTKGTIDPDEIFLDSSNLPAFDTYQFEGRLERSITRKTFLVTGLVFASIGFIFVGKLWMLQIKQGEAFEVRSENNHLKHTTIFADRGLILDRNKVELAFNKLNEGQDFSFRKYISTSGVYHVLGFVKYPSKDKSGVYYDEKFTPKGGVEEYYNDELLGQNGLKITETDALGNVQSESVLTLPKDGKNLTLSIDSRVQSKLFEIIRSTAREREFSGGAGVIMDVHNGEILALTSFPEYDSNVMSDGSDTKAIESALTNKNNPFLNRAVSGLYIPGSIVKPYIAIGALEENIIDPLKKILSIGYITIPNPYDPTKKTIFRDWKAHGWVDMRRGIAESSDEYFYTIGGGYDGQKGLGILNIEKYIRMFGFGSITGVDLSGEMEGNIPSPEWKKETFNGEPWRIGDTYNSSIGQYGFQVTPIQSVRAVASIANGGTLITPTLLLDNPLEGKDTVSLPLRSNYFDIVREGMRQSVTSGVAIGLSMPGITVAAKTGTAELGVTKQKVNSWVTGYFPYENPRYAFAVLMERGDRTNTIGATYVMRQLFEWMYVNTPEYVR